MIKVIGFDLDDTLWDVAPIIIGAEAQLDEWLQNKVPDLKFTVTSMRKLNHQVLEEDPGLIKKITEFRRRTIKTALSLSGIPEAQSERLSLEAMEVFLQARNKISLFDGAEDVLLALAGRYILGALTNGNADINRLGLNHIFSFAFSAEQVGAPKPGLNLFTAALSHTSIRADEMIYVGDDPKLDIDPAKRAGLHTIWMDRGKKTPGEFLADATIREISELPLAVARIETDLKT